MSFPSTSFRIWNRSLRCGTASWQIRRMWTGFRPWVRKAAGLCCPLISFANMAIWSGRHYAKVDWSYFASASNGLLIGIGNIVRISSAGGHISLNRLTICKAVRHFASRGDSTAAGPSLNKFHFNLPLQTLLKVLFNVSYSLIFINLLYWYFSIFMII